MRAALLHFIQNASVTRVFLKDISFAKIALKARSCFMVRLSGSNWACTGMVYLFFIFVYFQLLISATCVIFLAHDASRVMMGIKD